MKITKHSFEMLSNTHDEAKLLIDSMAEKYRKLQVPQFTIMMNEYIFYQNYHGFYDWYKKY